MRKKLLPFVLCALLMGETVMAQTIEMIIGEQAFTVELLEHDAARAFADRLPMTLTFENFGSTERIAYLKQALTIGSAPTSADPKIGDLAYYIPWGNICVFVKDFRHSEDLVPMGKMSFGATKALKESGNQPVTFRPVEKKQ